MFLLQLLRLLLMLLLHLLFLELIRLLLRQLRVFLVLLLLDSLSFLFLRRAEPILFLLVRLVQAGVSRGLNDRLRRSRTLVRMGRSRWSRPLDLRWLSISVRIYRTCRRAVNLAGGRLHRFRRTCRGRHLHGCSILELARPIRL